MQPLMGAQPDQFDAYAEDELRTAGDLVEEHYDALIDIARQRRRRHAVGETMRTTALVHEAYLKLKSGQRFASRDHFLRSASLAMRHAVIDYARRKLTVRRDGGVQADEDAIDLQEYGESPEELVLIGNLLDQLAEINPRWLRIVDARYFAGMTEDETADMLSLSTRTVRRDWKDARSWLAEQMRG